jgi:hypothetical protein
VAAILSPLRTSDERAFALAAGDLAWQHEREADAQFTLLSGYPLRLEPGDNLESILAKPAGPVTLVTYMPKLKGRCAAKLELPAWAKPLPKWAPPPKFAETAR